MKWNSGCNFFPCVEPEEKSASQYFGECLELVGLADRYGYSHIRTVEHYFHPYGGYSPNPIVFLSAAAQISKKARIVTGAVLPVFNNPLKLAGEIAMLDGLSNGRLEVGIARAFVPEEFRHFKVELNESVARFDEGWNNSLYFWRMRTLATLADFMILRMSPLCPVPFKSLGLSFGQPRLLLRTLLKKQVGLVTG